MEKTKLFQAPTEPEAPLVSKRGGRVIHISFYGQRRIENGQKYSEITFPILSPDPASNKDVHFLKYPIYVGENRGRGQIYPDGNKSNNTVYNATATGIVSKIIRKEKGGTK